VLLNKEADRILFVSTPLKYVLTTTNCVMKAKEC